MLLSRKSAALLFVALFAVTPGAYAAKPKPVTVPGRPMTVSEARKSLLESLKNLDGLRPTRVHAVRLNRERVAFTFDNGLDQGENTRGFFDFAALTNVTVRMNGWKGGGYIVCANGKDLELLSAGHTKVYAVWFNSESAALQFAEAGLTLKAAALAPDPEETNFAAFTASAQAWLATTPKPEMTDEVLTLKLVAEDAFKQKDFSAALEAYRAALQKFPMWPEGQYNAALLAAEIEDYELAAQHMRRYLVLAPEAKDAAAAKGKLLLWQHKAKE